MIIAKGIKHGKELTVKYDKNRFLFNEEENAFLSSMLERELKKKPLIFGTYCAEDPHEELNILGVLEEHFFDEEPKIETDLKIDWEDEVY